MMIKFLTLSAVYFVLIVGDFGSAAVPRIVAQDKKTGSYLKQGVFTGGTQGKGFSILDVRRKLSKASKRDRWIVEIGDVYLKPNTGDVPYFHVGVTENPATLNIDLYQVHRSKLTEQQIQNKLARSPYVSKVSMIYDTAEGGMTFSVELVNAVEVEVFKMPAGKKSSRLVIDLIPAR